MSDPFRQVSFRRLPPFPGQHLGLGSGTSRHEFSSDLNFLCPDLVKSYLASNHGILDEYVMESISTDRIEAWLQKKTKNNNSDASLTNVAKEKVPVIQERYLSRDIIALEKDLSDYVLEAKNPLPFLYEITNVIGTATKADSFCMYVVGGRGNEISLYLPEADNPQGYILGVPRPIGYGMTVSSHVAKSRECLLVQDIMGDDRFPRGVGLDETMVQSVLCIPMLLPTSDLLCVMEFSRFWNNKPFGDAHQVTASAMVSLVGLSLYQTQINKTLTKQVDLNDFLLEVSKIMFDDMLTIDTLVEKIMIYTKNLVQADRCGLFLVDEEKKELYSNLFDEGTSDEKGEPIFIKKDQIRFSMEKGIASHVAKTGEVINIPDAYSDPRFNREVDIKTGYTTKNILAMPIISKGIVIGVVQMINKKSESAFTHADEASFKTFAVYCAIALHYSKIYREQQLQAAQFSVAMDQLSYHSHCSEEECSKLLVKPTLPEAEMPKELNSFYYYGPDTHEGVLPELFIQMCHNLFGENSFDMNKLCRFVLTVKKNYRPVAYHNWKHGWNVSHSMYCMLTSLRDSGKTYIDDFTARGLMIGSVCHDIDHRGFNNAYFTKFNLPMANLYQTSVMEQHHYVNTVKLLQQENMDIFSYLSGKDYKRMLEVIRHAIIATDLALYFGNQKNLAKRVLAGTMDLNNNRTDLQDTISLMMTAADLCAIMKPWPVQKEGVKYIYEEFYFQGDSEKSQGSQPIPMMDRDNIDNIPKDQIGFIKFVCLPCYQTLADILPETSDLAEGCKDNLYHWERVAEGKSIGVWEPKKSVVEEDDKSEDKE